MNAEDDVWTLSQSGFHESTLSNSKPKKYGIALCVQKIFTEIIDQNQEITAKRLLNKVANARKLNQEKPIVDREEKYNFPAVLVPELKQVKN